MAQVAMCQEATNAPQQTLFLFVATSTCTTR